jgi:hypothetical protein
VALHEGAGDFSYLKTTEGKNWGDKKIQSSGVKERASFSSDHRPTENPFVG